jgi:membrane protease YdiL (CAAX protease family)
MNRRLALLALAAIPLLWLVFRFATTALQPFAGYVLGLCIYWTFLAITLLVSTTPADRARLLTARPAGRLITALCLLPVIVLGLAGMASLHLLPMFLLPPIALAALTNGFLEELFWRGALVPDPSPPQAALAVLLFAFWHVALLGAQGIALTGGPATLLLGAAGLGTIWMAARRRTGSVGLSALSHVGVNLFAFILLAADNLPPGWQPVPL